ncbi:MAG TPA: hypothetical protein VN442_10625 [Bryobacteraceae bacterium]|nr:hypothetical protein [Bryobacteraceae bacterium]
MRFLLVLASMAVMLPGAAADVSFTLAAKAGRTTFRMGEPVDVEFRFQADAPGKYRVQTMQDVRSVRNALLDSFTAEPREFAVDPLADIPAQIGFDRPDPFVPPLAGTVVVERQLNEWLTFRQPGRYRITAETTRVRLGDTPVKLRSDVIEIEMVAPEPGWAEKRVAEAVAVLERGDPPPAIGQVYDQSREVAVRRAARTLRFLGTPAAARALARFFENGPMAAQGDLRAGLFGSPHRKEVIAAMEAAVAAPDVPVSYYMIGTLIELAAAETVPPDPAYPAEDQEALKRWNEEHRRRLEQTRPIERRYFSTLGDALARKMGQAHAVSLATLFTNGPQPPAPAVLAALMKDFAALPEGFQRMLLTSEWHRIVSPAVEPVVRSVAAGTGPGRDFALMRLYELNPEAGRAMILGRIRAGNIGREPRVLMLLPEKTIPELDGPLADALEQGKPVEPVLARYASPAVFARVRASHMGQPGMCSGPLFAYFFRVDPAWAASQLSERRKANPGGCALYLSPNEDLLMSPGLERAAIDDLRNPDPGTRRSAQSLLQYGGSSAAEQPLWDAFARLRESRVGPMDQGLEFGFTEALLKGAGWVLTPDRIDRLRDACITEQCRGLIASERRALEPPLRISLLSEEPMAAMVGPFRLRGEVQLKAKIGQFPRGTLFRFERGYGNSPWAASQRQKIRILLEAAGMRVEAAPVQ